MTPAARVQAAIDVLDLVVDAARSNGAPADRILSDWFRSRRFAGSKDRRAVRDLVYAAIRACGDVPSSGRAAMLRLAREDVQIAALFDGSRHAPSPIDPDEPIASGGIAPTWLEDALSQSGIDGESSAALLERAPLDVRINTLKGCLVVPPEGGQQTVAPNGLRYPYGTRIEDSEAYLDGMIEVQDTGSQIACLAVGAQQNETIIDLCAGAGGKSLALAAEVGMSGQIIASDTDRTRLSRLGPRAERAGASMIETRLLNPERELEAFPELVGKADAVLVDAPCSGTGTWRRNPEARWRLTPKQVARYASIQTRLLDVATKLVRPGGRLVFVTCSLLDAEGADQAKAFLERHNDWQADRPELPAGATRGNGTRLEPLRDGTDGFFIARFVRSC